MSGLKKSPGSNCPGVDHWKNGQPTDSNPTYAGLHYEDGKGWVTRDGNPIRLKSEPYQGSAPHGPNHIPGNPNIPAGYQRVAKGVECPIPGSEDGVCYYHVNGERAIWDAGDVYMVRK
jgi:hypothetical protein